MGTLIKERDYSLDLLKILATVVIILHHYQQVMGVHFDNGINFFGGTFYFGLVVELFFILSGYVIFPYVKKIYDHNISFSNFFIKRWIRLFPLLLISAVVCEMIWFFCQPYYDGSGITFWGTVINALGIQDGWVFANPYVNNPTWYITEIPDS